MSKITNREYRAIAKRPGKRGFGMSDRRDRPEAPTIEEVLAETTKDLAETPAEELIRIAEEDLSELAVGEVRAYPFTEEGLAQVGRDFDRNSTVVGFDNGEDSNPAIEDLGDAEVVMDETHPDFATQEEDGIRDPIVIADDIASALEGDPVATAEVTEKPLEADYDPSKDPNIVVAQSYLGENDPIATDKPGIGEEGTTPPIPAELGKKYEQPQSLGSIDGSRSVKETQ